MITGLVPGRPEAVTSDDLLPTEFMHMRAFRFGLILMVALTACAQSAIASGEAGEGILQPVRKLTPGQSERASDNYQKYCALCHGKDREGYANDHAPSLRSQSLMESGIPHAILRPMSYGRHGTAMGGYLDEVGGPMTLDETWDLTYWIYEQSGVGRIALTTEAVLGDVTRGEVLYQQHCTDCHGKNGEGVNAPAIGNPSALAHNSDQFIRHAIQNGRQGTPMKAFRDILSADDIDSVTAFLRSQAAGWKKDIPVLRALPTPDQYVINPDGDEPEFELQQGRYITSEALHQALVDKKRMVLMDTRVTSVWQMAHIEGSIPLPYYEDLHLIAADLPRDVMIVAYCSCPRAASDWVIDQLREQGFTRTAVLYEGIFGWINQGFPVRRGAIREQ
jgi:mono/diheme cytochrome c family protein/rhodanese-related sulfurtransferase